MYEFKYIPPEEHHILNKAKQVLRENGESTTWISHMLACGKPDLNEMHRHCLTNVDAEMAREKFFLLSKNWKEGVKKCRQIIISARNNEKRKQQHIMLLRLLEEIVEESKTPVHRKINERWLKSVQRRFKK